MNKLKNKAFTIIELIVVIAVLGVLVLLAAPKFSGYTSEAKMSQIKNDIKTYEVAVESELVRNEDFIDDWISIPQSDLDTMTGEVFYYDKNLGNIPEDGNGGDNGGGTPLEPGKPTYPIEHTNGDKEYKDGTIEHPDGSVEWPYTGFEWVIGDPRDTLKDLFYTAENEVGLGYYKYVGSESIVTIP